MQLHVVDRGRVEQDAAAESHIPDHLVQFPEDIVNSTNPADSRLTSIVGLVGHPLGRVLIVPDTKADGVAQVLVLIPAQGHVGRYALHAITPVGLKINIQGNGFAPVAGETG